MNDESATPPAEAAPYIIEGARSSRSRCKVCRRAIEQGTLRIGYFIEGPYGTGYLWHHLKCAARRHFDRVEDAYRQEAWNAAKVPPTELPDLEDLRKLQDQADERKRTRKTIPYVEAAPSGRSTCKSCGKSIEKGGLRVALGRGITFGSQTRVAAVTVHPACVAAGLRDADNVTEVPGLAEALSANSPDLTPEQIALVLAEIGDLGEFAGG